MDGGIRSQYLMVRRDTTMIFMRAMFGWLLVSEAN